MSYFLLSNKIVTHVKTQDQHILVTCRDMPVISLFWNIHNSNLHALSIDRKYRKRCVFVCLLVAVVFSCCFFCCCFLLLFFFFVLFFVCLFLGFFLRTTQ